MTLIECFDREPVDNLVGCLKLRPDKLVFLGNKEKMSAPVERYRRFFKDRGVTIRTELFHVDPENMDATVAGLKRLILEEKECVIDVTGGDEKTILAVGMALGSMDEEQRENVTVQQFDITQGKTLDCDGDGQILTGTDARLSVREMVALHGGIVYPAVTQPEEQCNPKYLRPLWDLVCKDPREWNTKVSRLNEFQSRSEDKMNVYLPISSIAGGIRDFEEKETIVREFLEELHNCGVIHDRSSYNVLRYSYTDPIFSYALSKAGNMLELMTLAQARCLRQGGKRYFNDCQTSVHIDWDGIVHDDAMRKTPETRNEIDMIAMHGMVPLFVSCKNGGIEEVELYKLNTVAERFGGPYAKKLLIATDLMQTGSVYTNLTYEQRAEDMNIHLVKNAAGLSDEGWAEAFRKAIEE